MQANARQRRCFRATNKGSNSNSPHPSWERTQCRSRAQAATGGKKKQTGPSPTSAHPSSGTHAVPFPRSGSNRREEETDRLKPQPKGRPPRQVQATTVGNKPLLGSSPNRREEHTPKLQFHPTEQKAHPSPSIKTAGKKSKLCFSSGLFSNHKSRIDGSLRSGFILARGFFPPVIARA